MKVLVACEESQEVCKAFRARGHEAFSCDIQECSGGHPEWHIQGDVLPIINGNCTFQTADTHTHTGGTMGYGDSFPAVYASCSKRGKTLRAEAKGRAATKSNRVLYANGACRLRPRSRRKPCVHHVKRMEEAGSNSSAVSIRTPVQKNNVPVAQRSAAFTTD